MHLPLLFNLSTEVEGWNSFFTSLARAEQAAAEQCEIISSQLEILKMADLAEQYRQIGREEIEHIGLVRDLCRQASVVPARAEAIYQGKLMTERPSLAERMAVFHLAFETSALSFLGYLCPRVQRHFGDRGWAKQIRETSAVILRQEVNHIADGKSTVLDFLAREDAATRQTVARSLRRHQTFLRVGLKSFFTGAEGHPFLKQMLQKYERHFHYAVQGII